MIAETPPSPIHLYRSHSDPSMPVSQLMVMHRCGRGIIPLSGQACRIGACGLDIGWLLALVAGAGGCRWGGIQRGRGWGGVDVPVPSAVCGPPRCGPERAAAGHQRRGDRGGPGAVPVLLQGFPGRARAGRGRDAGVCGGGPGAVSHPGQRDRGDRRRSSGDRLRFESFSGCGGVHARLDLLPDAPTEQPVRSGSTNVDFNEGMRAALAGATVAGPLLLSVGADAVAVTTLGTSATERKVTLPERWLKALRRGAGTGEGSCPFAPARA